MGLDSVISVFTIPFLDVSAGDISEERFIELSRFVREVLSRRVEQIPEVAMVDISGLQGSTVLITPARSRLDALGLGPEALETAIRGANLSLGHLTLRDGHYQWNVRFDAELRSAADIADVRLGIHGRVYRLGDLADVSLVPAETAGLVRSNETAGFIITCLENETTEAEIVAKMQKKYDGPKEAMERDVKKIIDQLRKIGAIDE